MRGKVWTFPCQQWLARDKGDGRIDRELAALPAGQIAYQVTVKTGSVADAGTNANVYLTLYGSAGSAGRCT